MTPSSIQTTIEQSMKDLGLREERWDTIVLFSSEGLPMASAGRSSALDQERLLEFAFSLLQTTALLEDESSSREIIIRTSGGTRIVFRFFSAWNEDLILAAVISGRKGYRLALNRLVRAIRDLG